MDTEKQAELVRLYIRADEAAKALHTQATGVYEMTKRIEELTKDTTISYAGLRVRVVARAAFEQAGTSAESWRRWVRSLEARRKGLEPLQREGKEPSSVHEVRCIGVGYVGIQRSPAHSGASYG